MGGGRAGLQRGRSWACDPYSRRSGGGGRRAEAARHRFRGTLEPPGSGDGADFYILGNHCGPKEGDKRPGDRARKEKGIARFPFEKAEAVILVKTPARGGGRGVRETNGPGLAGKPWKCRGQDRRQRA